MMRGQVIRNARVAGRRGPDAYGRAREDIRGSNEAALEQGASAHLILDSPNVTARVWQYFGNAIRSDG